jgi:plasmid replication initiation protein
VPEQDTDERDAEALERLPVLPTEAWQARYDIVERFGRTLTVRVEGHSRLGMPRGRDLDVLLAVLALYAEDYQRVLAGHPSRLVDGGLADVSVNEILGAMGIPADDRNGTASRRVRQALRRFGHLKFTSTGRVFRDAAAEAAALAAGDPAVRPRVPDRTGGARGPRAGGGDGVVTVEEEVTHLLEYAWHLSFARSPAGELRITRLRLNPRFHEHLVTGWVAWIEADRYRALSSPLARRLYVLLAGEAATGRPAPWALDLRALRAACGMSPHRYANEIKKDLVRACAELADVGVLAEGPAVESPRKGEWTLTFEPGPALALAALLRGTSVVDLTSDRAQLAFLHYFGFEAAAARDLLAQAPHAVYDALCYALYVREVDPGRVTRSWRGFILERVAANRPNSGDVGFAAWAAKRLTVPAGPAAPGGATPDAAPARSGPRRPAQDNRAEPDVAASLARDPAAAAAWQALQDVLTPAAEGDVTERQLIRHLVPVTVAGDTLVLGTDLLFAPSTVRRVRSALATALGTLSGALASAPDAPGGEPGARLTRVRIAHVWAGRDGTAPTLRPMLGGDDDPPEQPGGSSGSRANPAD